MADIEYGNAGGADHGPDSLALVNVLNWLGALLSAALLVGLGVWAYQLMMRDVSGVPVIRALQGPMRVAPEDPGGKAANYQGLAVNNIAADGQAAPPVDKVVLAPAPVALGSEDLPAARLAPANSPETVAPTPQAAPAEPVDQEALIEAALRIANGVEPDAASASEGAGSEVLPASVPGLARSLRPVPRPARQEVAANVTSEDGVRVVDPASIATGTQLAQVGTFASPEDARREWARLTSRFADYMAGKGRVIQKATSGGTVFYRLRVEGFSDRSDSRRFCAALLAGQAKCIPVAAR